MVSSSGAALNVQGMCPDAEAAAAGPGQDSMLPEKQDDSIDLYAELWRACAGPHVFVPQVGDWVVFFPQGHMEQVDVYTNQSTSQQIPNFNLPSQFLCKVVHVQLKAEHDTDEIYAQVTLLPVKEGDETKVKTVQSSPPKSQVRSFCKVLTASDTSTHGGLSVLRRHADHCFPPLNMSEQPPTQMLVAKDVHGIDWNFRHIYRGQPRRHLLTGGWSTFVSSKKLVAGDAFIFLRSVYGELGVGIRRARKQENNISTSVISGQSMQLGVLATASHALLTGTIFSVYYQPRTSPSEFMIPYNKYRESLRNDYEIGMRFSKSFGRKEGLEVRCTGTIIGLEEVNPSQWPGSKWRSLKVHWDEPSNILRPECISPWEIELLSVTDQLPEDSPSLKKLRTNSFQSYIDGLSKNAFESRSGDRWTKFLQGQENITLPRLSSSNERSISNLRLDVSNMVFETSANLNGQSYAKCDREVGDSPTQSLTMESSVSVFEKINEPLLKAIENVSISRPTEGGVCKIFGVDLCASHLKCASETLDFDDLGHCGLLNEVVTRLELLDCDQVSQLFKAQLLSDSSGSTSRGEKVPNKYATTCRSCTKVHKQGTALGRSVDLAKFDGYHELTLGLEKMFNLEGELSESKGDWEVLYADNEGGTMLLGDYPWQEFCSMVRKIFICMRDKVSNLNPSMLQP